MSPKTKNIIAWILAGLLIIAFLGAGISKLTGADMQLKNLESWGYPLWMRFPIGLGEVALAVGLALPAYRLLAIYGVYAWGVVAIITHLQATPPQYDMMAGPLVFLLLNTALYFVSRTQKIAA